MKKAFDAAMRSLTVIRKGLYDPNIQRPLVGTLEMADAHRLEKALQLLAHRMELKPGSMHPLTAIASYYDMEDELKKLSSSVEEVAEEMCRELPHTNENIEVLKELQNDLQAIRVRMAEWMNNYYPDPQVISIYDVLLTHPCWEDREIEEKWWKMGAPHTVTLTQLIEDVTIPIKDRAYLLSRWYSEILPPLEEGADVYDHMQEVCMVDDVDDCEMELQKILELVLSTCAREHG